MARAIERWRWLGLLVLAFGCAPSQSFRPAGALPAEKRGEVGVALSRIGPRPYVTEEARPMAQGWWSTRWGESWLSTFLLGFDQSALLGGWALRRDIVQSRFALGAEAEVGFGWAALSAPFSFRALDWLQPYCAPRIGNWGSEITGFVPCGISAQPWHGFAVRAELQLSWADFEYYNRRLHVGLGLAQQW